MTLLILVLLIQSATLRGEFSSISFDSVRLENLEMNDQIVNHGIGDSMLCGYMCSQDPNCNLFYLDTNSHCTMGKSIKTPILKSDGALIYQKIGMKKGNLLIFGGNVHNPFSQLISFYGEIKSNIATRCPLLIRKGLSNFRNIKSIYYNKSIILCGFDSSNTGCHYFPGKYGNWTYSRVFDKPMLDANAIYLKNYNQWWFVRNAQKSKIVIPGTFQSSNGPPPPIDLGARPRLVQINDTHIFILANYQSGDANQFKCFILNWPQKTFATIPDRSHPVFNFGAGIYYPANFILVAGGKHTSDNQNHKTEYYDINSNTWGISSTTFSGTFNEAFVIYDEKNHPYIHHAKTPKIFKYDHSVKSFVSEGTLSFIPRGDFYGYVVLPEDVSWAWTC